MKINRITLTVLALLLAGSLSAQVSFNEGQGSFSLSTVNMEPNQVDVIDGVATMRYENSAASLHGSPYLYKEFRDGTMTALDGTVVPGLKYRYDIYGDKMQFILNGDTATIFKPLALSSIKLGNQKFVYEVFMLEADRVATGYFEVIEENEHMTVLFKREIELEQDIYVSNYGGGGGTKEFKMKQVNSYYIKNQGSAALKINNKRDFLEVIDDHQDQVRQYMKEKKLSVKKAKDLQAIASYYSSLLESGS